MTAPDPLNGYAADAARLVPCFEALSTAEVLAPVADLLPAPPCRVIEIGAGTGRDAAWLAAQGHEVLAVEPVRPLREAGMALHPVPYLRWLDDRLPGLKRVRSAGDEFDFILLVGVWQHLPPAQHREAMASLARFAAPGGRLILSLRHGPGAPARPCFPAEPHHLVALAADCGLELVLLRKAKSVQQKNRDTGVSWTWLCLERPLRPPPLLS